MRADRPKQIADEPPGSESSGSAGALVVVAEPTQWSRPALRYPAPDPTFVAQLIANAQSLSPFHNHLGESTADASSAYRERQHRPFGTGRLTRQTI